ncbi:MAG: CPBP family glutamic-type intramembrane protease [Acidobacteria bacterium]|nr:CPBP family glutamic-type intramembrane protease [Acidobacteriota bacterium]
MNLPTTRYSFSNAPAGIRYALILTMVLTSGGLLVIASIPVSLFDKASVLVSFGLLLLPYLLFTSRHFLKWLRERTARSLLAFPALLLAVYILYGLGPGRLRVPESLFIPVYIGFPILFASLAVKRGERPNRFDFLAVLFLYLPVELAALARAWLPASPDIPSPSHPFTQLLAMNLALFCFLAVRPLAGIGFTFRLKGRDVVQALIAFGWFFPLALVFGTVTGFVPFEPHLPNPVLIIPVILGVTFMVALPEEVLFRGLIQNLFLRTAGTARGRFVALLVASILFGLSHLNNHPTFDWRYVSIASLAGIAYGTVYNRTGKVTAAAITHALVDIVWRLCF